MFSNLIDMPIIKAKTFCVNLSGWYMYVAFDTHFPQFIHTAVILDFRPCVLTFVPVKPFQLCPRLNISILQPLELVKGFRHIPRAQPLNIPDVLLLVAGLVFKLPDMSPVL